MTIKAYGILTVSPIQQPILCVAPDVNPLVNINFFDGALAL
jgi:hypothetical protein